jgi:hypothetical protein
MLKKTKVVRKSIAVFMAVLLSAGIMQAQVRIGQNEAPRGGVILDLAGGYKGGLLLPRVKIDDLGKIPTDFSDASVRGQDDAPELAGMVVWNTRSGFEGVYIWDGKDWKRMEGETILSYPSCSAPPVGLLASLYGTKDADGNLRIDIPSGLDARGAISPFNLTVTSEPLGSLATVTNTYNGGLVFNPAQTWTIDQLQASPTVYNLQAADMSSGTGAVTAADPWRTRQTVLTFSGESACPPVPGTRTVTLNQTNYVIKPTVASFAFKNTDRQMFRIDANVAWKVKSIDDPHGIMKIEQMTTATTGGENRSDNNKTTSGIYYVTGLNEPNKKYYNATITLEDTNNPKRAKDVTLSCMSCLGNLDMTSVTKTATWQETAAGAQSWNEGNTKADKLVRHQAKPVDPTDPSKGNIYEEFYSADFGPAGRWMVTNLAAKHYDGIRHSTDTDPGNPATSSTGPKRTLSGPAISGANNSCTWTYGSFASYTTDTQTDADYITEPSLGFFYTFDAATAGGWGSNLDSWIYRLSDFDESFTEYYPDQINGNTTTYPGKIGVQYQWRHQGICPSGWHLPSHYESILLLKEIIRNTPLYTSADYAINPLESNDRNNPSDIILLADPGSYDPNGLLDRQTSMNQITSYGGLLVSPCSDANGLSITAANGGNNLLTRQNFHNLGNGYILFTSSQRAGAGKASFQDNSVTSGGIGDLEGSDIVAASFTGNYLTTIRCVKD